LGEPVKDGSSHYRPVLDFLDDLNEYLDTTDLDLDPNGMEKQLDRVLHLMEKLENATLSYIEAKEGNKKAQYMANTLLPVIRNVRVSMISKIIRFKVDPPHPQLRPKWYIIANSQLTRSPRKMEQSSISRESKSGSINTVDFYKVNMSEEFVFKADKKTIDSNNQAEVDAAKSGGINFGDAKFAKRSVALYRLDQLLGGDLIPKTEFAMRVVNKKKEFGAIMGVASGKSFGRLAKEGYFVHKEGDKQGKTIDKDGKNQSPLAITDPVLQRCLSRLQLLDALAFQVDRHGGNFYVQFDENGNVTGVKGIDNDMAFGEKDDIKKRAKEFPGISQFVDKEMAERIMQLRPEHLEAALGDLLSPQEMQALISRLQKLQQHLSSATLLEPEQWNEATAMMQLQEKFDKKGGSYFADMYDYFLMDHDQELWEKMKFGEVLKK